MVSVSIRNGDQALKYYLQSVSIRDLALSKSKTIRFCSPIVKIVRSSRKVDGHNQCMTYACVEIAQ
jgi:hypothetical protein